MIYIVAYFVAGPTLMFIAFFIGEHRDSCRRRRMEFNRTRLQFIDALMDQPWRDN